MFIHMKFSNMIVYFDVVSYPNDPLKLRISFKFGIVFEVLGLVGNWGRKMVGNVVYKGPSVIKEIIYGVGVGLMAGGLWKMHHWNYQRRTKEFYELLDRGDITVVLPEDN